MRSVEECSEFDVFEPLNFIKDSIEESILATLLVVFFSPYLRLLCVLFKERREFGRLSFFVKSNKDLTSDFLFELFALFRIEGGVEHTLRLFLQAGNGASISLVDLEENIRLVDSVNMESEFVEFHSDNICTKTRIALAFAPEEVRTIVSIVAMFDFALDSVEVYLVKIRLQESDSVHIDFGACVVVHTFHNRVLDYIFRNIESNLRSSTRLGGVKTSPKHIYNFRLGLAGENAINISEGHIVSENIVDNAFGLYLRVDLHLRRVGEKFLDLTVREFVEVRLRRWVVHEIESDT